MLMQHSSSPAAAAAVQPAHGAHKRHPHYSRVGGEKRRAGGPPSDEPLHTLWIGDLDPWEDETYLASLLPTVLPDLPDVDSVKVVRDSHTGQSLGFGFLSFSTNVIAAEALERLKVTQRPGKSKRFKVTWAASNTHNKSGSRGAVAGAVNPVSPALPHPHISAGNCHAPPHHPSPPMYSRASASGTSMASAPPGPYSAPPSYPPPADSGPETYVVRLDCVSLFGAALSESAIRAYLTAAGYHSVVACHPLGDGAALVRFVSAEEAHRANLHLCGGTTASSSSHDVYSQAESSVGVYSQGSTSLSQPSISSSVNSQYLGHQGYPRYSGHLEFAAASDPTQSDIAASQGSQIHARSQPSSQAPPWNTAFLDGLLNTKLTALL